MADGEHEGDVNTEKGQDGDENMAYSEDIVTGKSGIKLYQWQYTPTKNTARALLFIVHGYGEHSKRYDEVAKLFCSQLDCVVVSHDHVGHGKSEGGRVMVKSFDVYVEDIFEHIEQVKESHPQLPVYLLGHSMGGNISILTACKRPDYFSGVVLSAPAIVVHPDIAPGRLTVFFGKLISRIWPSLEILTPIDPHETTTDEEEAKNYAEDPLNWHGAVKCGWGSAFSDAMDKIQHELLTTIQWPFLVIHGDIDKITYIGGAELLMEKAPSKDKEMKVYKGLKHDLFHEVKDQREQIVNDVIEWLKKRIVT